MGGCLKLSQCLMRSSEGSRKIGGIRLVWYRGTSGKSVYICLQRKRKLWLSYTTGTPGSFIGKVWSCPGMQWNRYTSGSWELRVRLMQVRYLPYAISLTTPAHSITYTKTKR